MLCMPQYVFVYRCAEQDKTNTEETVNISSVNMLIVPLQEGPYNLHKAQEPLQVRTKLMNFREINVFQTKTIQTEEFWILGAEAKMDVSEKQEVFNMKVTELRITLGGSFIPTE